jgi:predicted dehydrogenase
MSINTIVFGTGKHAEKWCKYIIDHEKYKLKYIISDSQERGNELAQKFNCKYSNNFQDLLKNNKIDLSILTSHPNKNIYAIKLAENKINLIIEKPLAFNLVNCDNILNSCKKNNILCGSGLIRYFDSYFEIVENYLEIVGKCYHAELNILLNEDIRNKDLFSSETVDRYGDIFLGHLIHYFVQLNKLFGTPNEILATSIFELDLNLITSANVQIKYNDTFATINLINNFKEEFGEVMKLYCEKGLIEINFNNQSVRMVKNPFNDKLTRPFLRKNKRSVFKAKFSDLKLRKEIESKNFSFGSFKKVLDSFSNIFLNLKDDEIVDKDKQYLVNKMSLASQFSIKKKSLINL